MQLKLKHVLYGHFLSAGQALSKSIYYLADGISRIRWDGIGKGVVQKPVNLEKKGYIIYHSFPPAQHRYDELKTSKRGNGYKN